MLIRPVLAALVLSASACGASSDNAANTAPPPVQEAAVPAPTQAPGTIVDVAAGAGTFKTLLAAAEAAGLTDALNGPGPMTVFAPTDDAFAKLPSGTVDGLLADRAKLATILEYHVVSGAVTASQVAGMTSATTLEGRSLTIDASTGVRINDATVVMADIRASNGIIHAIDTVLIPR